MILYPPVVFNINEWFDLVITALLIIVLWLLPRRFSPSIIVLIWSLNGFLASLADFSIAVPPFDLYDFNDRPQFEYFDLALYFFTYPATAYVIVYFADRWGLRGWKLAGYVLLTAAVTVGLEGVSVLFHVFTYKGWKLSYSGPVYLVVYSLNIALQRFASKRQTA